MKISLEKKDKICEQIINLLYSISPKPVFTSEIAREIARDEEFTKNLIIDLKKKDLVQEIRKNPKGLAYRKRQRWILSPKAYSYYKNKQL